MRLVILADPVDNQRAGVHRVTWNMIDQLAKDAGGHEVILIREKRGTEGWPFEEYILPNTRWPIGWASFRLFVLVPILCRKLKVDAVLEPAHFGPWNLPQWIRRITFIHDLTPVRFPQYHRWHSQLLQRIFLKRIIRNADLLLTNTEHTTRDLVAYYPNADGKVVTVHLGVDDRFRPVNEPGVFRKYALDGPYFLFTGTIEPRKNLTTLLKAYELYRSKGGLAQLVIVGQAGWKARGFYDALRKHPYRNDIQLPGFVPDQDLPALYSHALAFLYPSEYEGFGLPVLEAMACGTPAIVAKNSSLTEVSGQAALFVDTFDAAAFARKMIELEQDADLVRHYGQLGMEQAKRFTWTAFHARFMQALEQLEPGTKKPGL